ncbi:MAG TPA: SRPBCC family protein [Vicinamibacterales bacterium]|nr:SRPBCC family protein [Vicinamibacterales bacterium]
MHRNVNDWERLASVVAGVLLLNLARQQQGSVRNAAAAGGIGLVARGAAGYCPINAVTGRTRRRDDPRRALSGRRGVRIDESVTIQASASTLFAFWRNPEYLPKVFPHLAKVESLDANRSRWTIRGPAGVPVSWDARIVNEIPGEKIAWESLPGSDVASAGSVTFRPLRRGGTEIRVVMQYDPPAGKLGASLAWLLGRNPSADVRESLRTLKRIIETGEVATTEGQSAGARRGSYRIIEAIA